MKWFGTRLEGPSVAEIEARPRSENSPWRLPWDELDKFNKRLEANLTQRGTLKEDPAPSTSAEVRG